MTAARALSGSPVWGRTKARDDSPGHWIRGGGIKVRAAPAERAPIKIILIPAEPIGMYLWWLPDLAAPAILLISIALLMIVAVLFMDRRRNAVPASAAGQAVTEARVPPDRPQPAPRPAPARSWRSLKEWAPVVAIYLTLLAIVVSGLLLSNLLVQQARDEVVDKVESASTGAVWSSLD